MAQEAVIKYLVDTNRPYSCADVTVNLRGVYSKGVIQKTLDALSESGKIRCKLYGKQKVYAAVQTETTAGDDEVEGSYVFCKYYILLNLLPQSDFREKCCLLQTLDLSFAACPSFVTGDVNVGFLFILLSKILTFNDAVSNVKVRYLVQLGTCTYCRLFCIVVEQNN